MSGELPRPQGVLRVSQHRTQPDGTWPLPGAAAASPPAAKPAPASRPTLLDGAAAPAAPARSAPGAAAARAPRLPMADPALPLISSLPPAERAADPRRRLVSHAPRDGSARPAAALRSEPATAAARAQADEHAQARAFYRKARALLAKKRLREALGYAHKALTYDRSDARAIALCGYLVQLCERGSARALAQALELLERAVAIEPEYAEGWFFRGLVLHAAGREADAALCFERVLDLDPDHIEAARRLRDRDRRREGDSRRVIGRIFRK